MPADRIRRSRRPSLSGQGRVSLFVRCPRAQERLLADELQALGAAASRIRTGGVQCQSDLATGYRICFASRLASRVLWPLAAFPSADAEALYAGVSALPWPELMQAGATLAVSFDGVSRTLRHTGFSAQRCKDAVVDSFRAAGLARPDVAPRDADFRLHGVLHRDRVTLYLDLAGAPLHQRGWRQDAGPAPLKENLAAALLLRGGWRAGSTDWLADPLCGGGTLLVEGALIAAGIAPGHLRDRWGFQAWTGHDESLFEQVRAEFPDHSETPLRLYGRDQDSAQIERTRLHLQAAGLGTRFQAQLDLEQAELGALQELPAPLGLVAANPPYGARLEAGDVLTALGQGLQRMAPGAALALLIGQVEGGRDHQQAELTRLLQALQLPGLEASPCRNGPLPAWMLVGRVPAESSQAIDATALDHARMFANRLRKNSQRLGRWAARQGTDAYRVYDRDLPEYGLVIDRYGDAACVQEIAPPAAVDPVLAARRRDAALHWIPETLAIEPANLFFRERRRQTPATQYQAMDNRAAQRVVQEGDARLLVNLSDYLDTGLYLDSRGVRRWVADHYRRHPDAGCFLNLCAYTGTASIQAALAGARRTLSVDLSRTYLDWYGENLKLNGLDSRQHRRVRADLATWLTEAGPEEGPFGLILLDAPTFSNSRRTRDDLDIQRDHPALINAASRLLEPGGRLLFVTHARRFRWQSEALDPTLQARELTRQTLDQDCGRGRPAHRSWLLQPG